MDLPQQWVRPTKDPGTDFHGAAVSPKLGGIYFGSFFPYRSVLREGGGVYGKDDDWRFTATSVHMVG